MDYRFQSSLAVLVLIIFLFGPISSVATSSASSVRPDQGHSTQFEATADGYSTSMLVSTLEVLLANRKAPGPLQANSALSGKQSKRSELLLVRSQVEDQMKRVEAKLSAMLSSTELAAPVHTQVLAAERTPASHGAQTQQAGSENPRRQGNEQDRQRGHERPNSDSAAHATNDIEVGGLYTTQFAAETKAISYVPKIVMGAFMLGSLLLGAYLVGMHYLRNRNAKPHAVSSSTTVPSHAQTQSWTPRPDQMPILDGAPDRIPALDIPHHRRAEASQTYAQHAGSSPAGPVGSTPPTTQMPGPPPRRAPSKSYHPAGYVVAPGSPPKAVLK